MVRGLTTQKAQSMDPSFDADLTGHLFKVIGRGLGVVDLALMTTPPPPPLSF